MKKDFMRSFSVQSKISDGQRGSLRKRTMSAGSSGKEEDEQTEEEEVKTAGHDLFKLLSANWSTNMKKIMAQFKSYWPNLTLYEEQFTC